MNTLGGLWNDKYVTDIQNHHFDIYVNILLSASDARIQIYIAIQS